MKPSEIILQSHRMTNGATRQPEVEMHLPSYLYIEYDLAKKSCLFFLNQLIRRFASNSRLLGKT